MKKSARFSHSARLPELVAGFERVSKWLDDFVIEGDDYLAGERAALAEQTRLITAALKRDKTYSNLEELDGERDGAVRLLSRLVDGYTAHPDAKVSAAAARISEMMSKYSAVTKANYEEESGLLSSMFGDFDAASADVAALDGVSARLGILKAAQEAFEAAHKSYVAAKNDAASTESASSLKKKALATINDELVPYLATMRRVKGGDYEKLGAMIDGEIAAVNSKVSARAAAATGGSEKSNA